MPAAETCLYVNFTKASELHDRVDQFTMRISLSALVGWPAGWVTRVFYCDERVCCVSPCA